MEGNNYCCFGLYHLSKNCTSKIAISQLDEIIADSLTN